MLQTAKKRLRIENMIDMNKYEALALSSSSGACFAAFILITTSAFNTCSRDGRGITRTIDISRNQMLVEHFVEIDALQTNTRHRQSAMVVIRRDLLDRARCSGLLYRRFGVRMSNLREGNQLRASFGIEKKDNHEPQAPDFPILEQTAARRVWHYKTPYT